MKCQYQNPADPCELCNNKNRPCGPKQLPIETLPRRQEQSKMKRFRTKIIRISEDLQQDGNTEEDIISHMNLCHRSSQTANDHNESMILSSSLQTVAYNHQSILFNSSVTPERPVESHGTFPGLSSQSMDNLDTILDAEFHSLNELINDGNYLYDWFNDMPYDFTYMDGG